MADEPLEEGDPFDESAKKSGPSMVLVLVAALIGGGAGAYVGGPVATPVVAGFLASDGEGGGGGHGGGDGHGGGGEAAAEGPLTIDNLVLNPAGSGASRFLIATLVLESDDDAYTELSERDAEVRDMLLTTLASRTVEELADVSMRGIIREELRVSLNDMLGREGVHRIFFPTFVIQ